MAHELKYADKASQEMARLATEKGIDIVWDRFEAMQPQCGFGQLGLCCRVCSMGPCRIDPFGEGPQTGVCGANADTIAARHLVRMIAGGTAAHSDHGRDVANTLLLAADDKNADYSIKDKEKLIRVAEIYDIKTDKRDTRDIARDVALSMLGEFGRYKGNLVMARTAPSPRIKLWETLEILPRSIDREIVESMHRTTMGVDTDYKHLIRQGMRTALSDGWGGSMIATEIQDVLFGRPDPLRSQANLGVLKEDFVNLVVHGHEPVLSDIIATVAGGSKINELAKAKGARGVNVAGICCTANEILMRHGIPIAGSFMQQELAIMTGAVDLMVVDVQCIMPGLSRIADCFHTKIVTTSAKARFPGVEHIEFKEERAVKVAEEIIGRAIDNYKNRRKNQVSIPDVRETIVAGFTAESVYEFLGGKYRATYKPLVDAIVSGRIRGAAGVIGCSNPNVEYEEGHIKMVKELIKNDTLVVTTGCNAISCGKHGLLKPEAAFEFAGKGLQEVCAAVGIPPVLHLGSCVDNSRILRVLTNIVSEGGLGSDISDLPVAGAAPEWMSEKAVAIGFYFVASGVYTMIGRPLHITGSKNLFRYLTEEIEQETGGKWAFEPDPVEAAHKMLVHIDKKRKALKLKPMLYDQAFGQAG
jgi:carbon-monoxide dehydrogenase catalytic subunit